MHKLARLTPLGRLRMVRWLEAGARLCDVAAALDLSTTSVRRWWRRYQAEGIAGLSDRSCRPHRSPRALPHVQRRQIARRRQWGWSSLRIARDLRRALPTVVHVQRRLGLARRPPMRPSSPMKRRPVPRPSWLWPTAGLRPAAWRCGAS
jgi:transposase-like protein